MFASVNIAYLLHAIGIRNSKVIFIPAVPRRFLLFCDLNTVNLLPLEEGSSAQLEVIHYGSSESNYVAVAFDSQLPRVFFSDLTT